MNIMAKETKNKQDAPVSGIHEIHATEYRKYTVIGRDNSVIERTAFELCEGSRLLSNRNLWVANFSATIARVRKWCHDHKTEMQMALVDIRSNKVLFYFIPKSDRYNLILGEAMTALEVELGGSAGIGSVETLQVPQRSLDRFADERSLLVWEPSDTPA